MMWHAGLRGGIALVLALEIDGEWCKYKDGPLQMPILPIPSDLKQFQDPTRADRSLKVFHCSRCCYLLLGLAGLSSELLLLVTETSVVYVKICQNRDLSSKTHQPCEL
eukprot:4365139-Amphidinium_carterae.1